MLVQNGIGTAIRLQIQWRDGKTRREMSLLTLAACSDDKFEGDLLSSVGLSHPLGSPDVTVDDRVRAMMGNSRKSSIE